MDILWETLGFAAKSLVVLLTIAASAVIVFSRARPRRSAGPEGHVRVKRLDERMRAVAEQLRFALLEPKEHKRHRKQLARAEQERAVPDKSVFVLDFKGDVLASAVENLRHEVTALLGVAGEQDEVVLRLDSPGGAAHSYGLAASQLARLRDHGIKLVVCVDKGAASGGYMMACVASHIVAAPFSIVGSIGVAAPVPNLHRLLDRHGVDYENVTAGKYKRTVSYLAENTEEGRRKFQEQIDETHELFKNFVKSNRASLDIDEIATGEYWHAAKAKELGMVDELLSSDDYLMKQLDEARIFGVSYERPQRLRERIAGSITAVGEKLLVRLWTTARENQLV